LRRLIPTPEKLKYVLLRLYIDPALRRPLHFGLEQLTTSLIGLFFGFSFSGRAISSFK
jgi:hypothetical protein